MMPSLPNGVLNHGTPAYGYGPCAVSLVISRTSASDCVIQPLNWSFDVEMCAYSRWIRRARCSISTKAESKSGTAEPVVAAHATVISAVVLSCASRVTL